MKTSKQTLTFNLVVQQALRPNFTPITLDASEQALVLRYMRARCHSINRLHTQGITIHPDVAALIPSPTKASPKGSDQDAQSQISIIISRKKRGSKDQRATHKGDIAIDDFKDTPTPLVIQGLRKYKSVAIDCEMVTVVSGSNEVAFLSAVDCLTGAILINNYVLPSSKVLSWNTPSSGITPSLMNRAVRSGEAILGGWAGARQCLWDLIDADTVLVGHSISNDLNVLGMFHSKIVDSSILSAEAVFVPSESNQKLTRTWSLKTLAKELLGYEIQNRRTGHSALEDAYAARDVVIWCIQNPEEFKAWAEETHQKEMKKEEERKLAAEKAREKREKERLQQLQKSADESASGSTTPPWTSIGFDGTKEFDLVGSEATWVKVEKEKLAVFHGAGIGK
ncbi:Exonuclease RNase T/DNA polymerase III [Penicillium capsulatum]|uniref:Exonuclease RNase T/DNA polymerase III n=1 Tax=Penicillium capsulatum TaxID=69766 RepID=A0A9W9LL25_9EURO|nr:Exonuclease RNase T/DNA polymerase III [Penicillium capsulatum]KAJ6116465.1 Exonuclease RNase T/DNA polymerase III [Penicillium capsulatum]